MPYCIVRGCSNKSGHLFPKSNPTLKRKWLKFVGLAEDDVNSHSLICKIHFDEDQFDQHEFIEGMPPPRKRLKRNAVPTLHPNLEHLKPVVYRRKPPKPKVYDLPATTSSNRIAVAEVDLFRTPLLNEKQLATVIERIKVKLIKDTHPSSVFPPNWETSNLLLGQHMIREGFPPFSMPCLVSMAIEANPRRMLTPPQIVGFISQNFPCYKLNDTTWHGRVLETLETFKVFQKVPASFTDNPKKVFYKFVPDRQQIISPEVYEAFTDPHFDDSQLDLNNAVVSTSPDILSIASEDIIESRVAEWNEDFELSDLEENVTPITNDSTNVTPHELSTVYIEEITNDDDATVARRKLDEVTEAHVSPSEEEEEEEEEEEKEELSDSSGNESFCFIECSYCEFLAETRKTISAHVAQKHWNGSDYCCSQCNYISSTKENLMAHKATHKK